MNITDSINRTGRVLFQTLLPTYLANSRPVMILNSDKCPKLQLVFFPSQRNDLEIITFSETWSGIMSDTFTRAKDDLESRQPQVTSRDVHDLAGVLSLQRSLTSKGRGNVDAFLTSSVVEFNQIANARLDVQARYMYLSCRPRTKQYSNSLRRRHSSAFTAI